MQVSVYYSVIIPAFNEEDFLPSTLTHLQNAMNNISEKGELIVIDNNSSDRTAKIAGEFGAKVVFEAINQISRARNAGAKMAKGKYLIFLDADTLLCARLLHKALDALQTGKYSAGGVVVSTNSLLDWFPQRMLNIWNWISRHLLLAAGCFIYCSREAFEAVGGFSEKVYASEEIWLSLALRSWGAKKNMKFLIIEDPPVITSMRKLEWYSQGQLLLFSIPILLFPPLMCFRRFCGHWYRRENKSQTL